MLNSLVELGFHKSSYGLHSLRSGGASAVANLRMLASAFVCLKLHGRWKSDRAKDGFVMLKTTSIPFFQFLVP